MSGTMELLVLSLVVATTLAATSQDEVTDLPGLSFKPTFKQYSGYLKATGTRRLHYWFVESAGSPKNDPVVLWLNGGPGCSSLDGFLSEHGPFLAMKDGKTLKKNPYSWNNVANMLYLEAPAGVGYSYATDKNYTTGDDQVSIDNLAALKDFFASYPEFSGNSFYVFGESYGGIYVPTLSVRLASESTIKFKGFGVGNGLSDWSMNDNSIIYFGYFHGLWGDILWKELVQNCCAKGQTQARYCDFAGSQDPKCQNAVNQCQEIIGGLNVYNLYGECYPPPSLGNHANTTIIHPHHMYMFAKNPLVQKKWKKLLTSGQKLKEVPPCVDVIGMTAYLNQPEVRKALHIPDMLPAWEICSAKVGMLYRTEYQTMKSQYMKILQSGNYRTLVFNGDVDMACNFLGDEWFSDSLDQPVKEPRKSWKYKALDGTTQVAGYIKQFVNLNFVTVKGAGHMVPQDKPIVALEMFTNFLGNKKWE